MAAIKWDETGTHYYESGVDHGVLYVAKEDDDQTADTDYSEGVAWNGLTSVSESPDGAEPNDLWADNIKYATLRSAETFGATVEAYTYPDEFAECDGSVAPVNGVYLGQQKRKSFGFVYRTKIGSDINEEAGYKLHLIYGCTASPSEKSYDTINDSPDAITFSWEIDTVPVPVKDYKPVSSIVIDSTKADATKLGALEDMLFGTDGSSGGTGTEARLPTPSKVLQMMN